MRHVLVVMGLLLLSWQVAHAERLQGRNASGTKFERVVGKRGVVTTTYFKKGKPFATVTRYPSGALVVDSAKYEIHNNTHTGPSGVRLVVNKEKDTAKSHQADRQGHAIERPAKAIEPIEVWSLPGK